MNILKVFPLTGKVIRQEPKSLVIIIVMYLIVCAVVKVADFLLGWVPIVGWILSILFWVAGVYCAVGIILAILEFFRGDD